MIVDNWDSWSDEQKYCWNEATNVAHKLGHTNEAAIELIATALISAMLVKKMAIDKKLSEKHNALIST